MENNNDLYQSKCTTLNASQIHSILLNSMELYNYLTTEHQAVVFSKRKSVVVLGILNRC